MNLITLEMQDYHRTVESLQNKLTQQENENKDLKTKNAELEQNIKDLNEDIGMDMFMPSENWKAWFDKPYICYLGINFYEGFVAVFSKDKRSGLLFIPKDCGSNILMMQPKTNDHSVQLPSKGFLLSICKLCEQIENGSI